MLNMPTILVTWKPEHFPWGGLQDELAKIRRKGSSSNFWSVGNRREIEVGTRVFMIRQGSEPRGLVGSGWTTSMVEKKDHWDQNKAARGEKARYIGIHFDVLQDTPVVSIKELLKPPFETMHWRTQMSGISIPEDIAAPLEELWNGRTRAAHVFAQEETAGKSTKTKAHCQRVEVNRYERCPKARAKCLAHHGMKCSACENLLSDTYGHAANHVIHVHHLTRVSELPDDFEIDPVRDLRPVCPNCHSVIHSRQQPFSIEEMKEMIERSRI
jgi:5-methylcytosine-specific restriction protein A